jgi:SAM-dependent methyltransferase
MADSEVSQRSLTAAERAARSGSFGSAAAAYERYRPGPSAEAVEWILGRRPSTVVDLGAGTGALSRVLIDRADRVIAVEPDERMRTVFADAVVGVEVVAGQAESIPLADGSVDAVVASSSWHWVDPPVALAEVARVLRPGGVLGAVWTGADPNGPLMVEAMAALAGPSGGEPSAFSQALARNAPSRTQLALTIPDGQPFGQPEQRLFTWSVAMSLDDIVGLIGTFSWMLTLPNDERAALLDDARATMGRVLGIAGDQSVDVGFGADAYRTTFQHP